MKHHAKTVVTRTEVSIKFFKLKPVPSIAIETVTIATAIQIYSASSCR